MFTAARAILKKLRTFLNRPSTIEPENPEINYSLGMLYARRDQTDRAVQYLEAAITFVPIIPTRSTIWVWSLFKTALPRSRGEVQDMHPECRILIRRISISRACISF